MKKNNYVFNYSQYKKNINPKNNFSFIIIFLLIISLLGLCVFFMPTSKNKSEFYFIEIDNFQTYNDAKLLAQNVSESEGAGYVYFDGKYHVLASFYSNIKDAENVCENLKIDYKNVKVLTVSFDKFYKQKNLTTKQNSSVENLINTTRKIIFQLEDLIIKFNRKNLTFNEAQILIKEHQKSYIDVFDEFTNYFSTNSKFNIARTYAHEINNAFDILTKNIEQNFNSVLRYQIINIAISLTQFASSV